MEITLERSNEYRQRRALETGESQPQLITVEIAPSDLTAESRQVLLEIGGNSGEYPKTLEAVELSGSSLFAGRRAWSGGVFFAHDGEPDDVTAAVIDAELARIREELGQQLAKKRAEMASDDARRLAAVAALDDRRRKLTAEFLADPEARAGARYGSWVTCEYQGVKFGEGELLSEARRRRDADQRAASEEAWRILQAKNQQIQDWVSQYGTDSQRARLEAGMLPRSEVLDAMREQVFAPLKSYSRYVRVTSDEVRSGCEDWEVGGSYRYDYDVTFESLDETEATETQFSLLQEIRSAMPGDRTVATLRRHAGEWNCGDDDHPIHDVIRFSILVTVVVGEFRFSREYAA